MVGMVEAWERLERLLAEQPGPPAEPPGERMAAALALVSDTPIEPDGAPALSLVYTRRADDLRSHPGQISFPGGRVEPGESVEQAALREACEEIGLQTDSVRVLGRLPAFYIPPSRFWVETVVARWERPHELVRREVEVGEILRPTVATLCEPERWRAVRLSTSGWSWAWQLDERHLLWGATGMVTARLLDALAPGWQRGRHPAGLGADRIVRPWAVGRSTAAAERPARLPGVASERLAGFRDRDEAWDGAPTPGRLAAVARAGARAVLGLAGERDRPRVLVLAGGGGNGAAGRAVADRLIEQGHAATVVDTSELTEGFQGTLPTADVVVDALVGGGLTGPLARAALALTLALRRQHVAVCSLDLPTGLDGRDGLIGEVLPADVTLALGAPRPGVFHQGLAPFVGDLYRVGEGGELTRLVRPTNAWRE